jgi:hypothetical protein
MNTDSGIFNYVGFTLHPLFILNCGLLYLILYLCCVCKLYRLSVYCSSPCFAESVCVWDFWTTSDSGPSTCIKFAYSWNFDLSWTQSFQCTHTAETSNGHQGSTRRGGRRSMFTGFRCAVDSRVHRHSSNTLGLPMSIGTRNTDVHGGLWMCMGNAHSHGESSDKVGIAFLCRKSL